jgi:hypothetical protein
MTGASNKWADEGNCEFVDYMNVYTNSKIDVTAIKLVTVKKLNQNTLKKGDVLFTSASETPVVNMFLTEFDATTLNILSWRRSRKRIYPTVWSDSKTQELFLLPVSGQKS